MAEDRRADAPNRKLERAAAGGRDSCASRHRRTTAALLEMRPRRSRERYTFIANQIAMTTIATTIAHHTSGVTCFELPLRGESLAAWLNSLFISPPDLFENRAHLVPQRGFAVAVMLRWRGLRRADGIGGRETIDQTSFQLGMDFPVRLRGLAWIDGVLVMCRRIEFFSH